MNRIFMTPEQIGGMRLLNPPTKEVFLESRDFFSAVKRGKVLAVERMLERNESLVLDYDS
jgi:ankyrin repeat protein